MRVVEHLSENGLAAVCLFVDLVAVGTSVIWACIVLVVTPWLVLL